MSQKELHDLFLMQQNYATLFSVSNKIQAFGDEYLSEQLSSRQFMTLVSVAHLPPSETTLNNIAAKMGTSKQNAKKLLNNLQGKAYIEIVPSSTDKRAINVRITESGMLVFRENSEKAVYLMAKLFGNFSSDELQTLWSLLKKLSHFDGNPYNGFEEDVSSQFEVLDEEQKNIMETFRNLRKESVNG